MGRLRTKHRDLPPGVHRKGGRLYYGRNDVPLGPEGPEAWAKWAKLRGEADDAQTTFADAVREFMLRELHKRAPKTQAEYQRSFALLNESFGPVILANIRPSAIRAFLDLRPDIAGTRDKAAFSLVFNFARERGLTDAPNPAAGIRGQKSRREMYVTDDSLRAVQGKADRPTATFLELCYRTGADASVVLNWTLHDVRDGALHVRRTKTGAKVAITIEGPLRAVLDGLAGCQVASVYLIADERGQPFTLQTIRKRFWKARAAAGATWQIRDLRAKAASDSDSLKAAQTLLGHASESTTALYRRQRVGERARPVGREIADALPDYGNSRKPKS